VKRKLSESETLPHEQPAEKRVNWAATGVTPPVALFGPPFAKTSGPLFKVLIAQSAET